MPADLTSLAWSVIAPALCNAMHAPVQPPMAAIASGDAWSCKGSGCTAMDGYRYAWTARLVLVTSTTTPAQILMLNRMLPT